MGRHQAGNSLRVGWFGFDLDGPSLRNSVPVRDDMSKYRSQLPQLSGDPYITDGGIETTLIFLDGFDLPSFAAFVLLESESGTTALENYFRQYADLARKYGTGLILESPTWRTSSDWGVETRL